MTIACQSTNNFKADGEKKAWAKKLNAVQASGDFGGSARHDDDQREIHPFRVYSLDRVLKL